MKQTTLILHTSDLHLREKSRETIDALERILEKARNHKIDLLTIGGDLFDSVKDAEVLRPKLRELFSNNDFSIVAIPGNHDREAYSKDKDFGSDLMVSVKEPFDVFQFEGTAIVALPYKDNPTEQLCNLLKNAAKKSDERILLLHCTLDIGFTSFDFGEKTDVKYFPITRTTLSRWGYDYILAGHFHTRACVIAIQDKCNFVYPGSPVSHSKKETGKRTVYLVDTTSGEIKGMTLNSFYCDLLRVEVKYGQEDNTIRDIQKWIDGKTGDKCSLEVEVYGFIGKSEKRFGKQLEGLSDKVEFHHRYRNVKHILKHPLFRRFKEKQEANKTIGDVEGVELFVIDAMSRLMAEGKLME